MGGVPAFVSRSGGCHFYEFSGCSNFLETTLEIAEAKLGLEFHLRPECPNVANVFSRRRGQFASASQGHRHLHRRP